MGLVVDFFGANNIAVDDRGTWLKRCVSGRANSTPRSELSQEEFHSSKKTSETLLVLSDVQNTPPLPNPCWRAKLHRANFMGLQYLKERRFKLHAPDAIRANLDPARIELYRSKRRV